MFCFNCGKELDNNSKFCIYCGKSFITNDKTNVDKKSKFTKRVICAAVIGMIALIVAISLIVVILIADNSKLNKDEQLAYQNCCNLRNRLQDPDSLKLYDSILLLKHYDDFGNNDYTYTIFKYGAANGYGAIRTEQAILKDDEYIMDYDDEIDEDDFDCERKRKIKIELLDLEVSIEYLGEKPKEYDIIDIDVKKIKKKMGLK